MTKRLIALATVLALILALTPAVAMAAGPGAVSAAYGGGAAAYHGEGFAPETNYVVRLVKAGGRALVALCHVKSDSEGAFDVSHKVGKLAPGAYKVYVNPWSGSLAAEGSLTVAASAVDDAKLKSLAVEGYGLDPAFDPGVNSYAVNVASGVTSVTISAEANSAAAQVTGDVGEMPLAAGVNTFRVTVTAENGNENVYTIVITRAVFEIAVKTMLLKVGKPQQIPYTYVGPGPVVFTSSNPAVCAVSSDGVLTPLKVGAAVITVSAPGFPNYVFAVTISL